MIRLASVFRAQRHVPLRAPYSTTSPCGASAKDAAAADTHLKSDIVKDVLEMAKVSDKTKLTGPAALALVDGVFDSMIQAVKDKKTVKIAGFGTFKTKESKPYTGRSPKTGEPVDVPGKNRIRFVAYTAFKTSVESLVDDDGDDK